MVYPVYEIDEEQAQKILHVEENFLNDVKAKDIKPAKLSETVSAFANAGGGDIYIGISETGSNKHRSWKGFADVEEANDIAQTLFQAHPFGNHVLFEFLQCNGHDGYVLHITVKKVKEIVRSTKEDIFVRLNAGKTKIDTDEKIRRLELDKGIVTFEDEFVNIDLSRIENSHSIINFLINVVPNAEPLTYLNNQELIRDGQAKVCGVLLFCDEPAVYLPKRCSVKLMRYKTRDDDIGREFLDGVPQTIEGDAYNVIYRAVDQTTQIVEGIQRLGHSGLESITYPPETLHEIITNAILHRDYSVATDVQVRIFDNRIEVDSPGRLPGHVTQENILDTQSARNPTLVRLINKFPEPPNQDVGEGLNTAFRAMEALRLRPPEIQERESSVVVIIPHEPLASPEEIILDYMNHHDEINNRTARELTGIKSENSMKNVFLRLKAKNLLEPIPARKGAASAWRKPRG
ncbi:MAG: putative DNA binding domain-containing protein [Gammaproteobacteria bacterium]|nr:putative DNA binding domain-containing protein [Gammaproteobacteria bacterium]MCW8839860.1 putative DNA binding domain-containing protein [Gammaproteobacteria bacterium]MCW8958985.1 putative DNA binding domain-containing protein [Gammaproteobacteria bacterium]MCW8992918.1 putative DNA binding domain-containing protein [Gammaproteobacteria bacterium]